MLQVPVLIIVPIAYEQLVPSQRAHNTRDSLPSESQSYLLSVIDTLC